MSVQKQKTPRRVLDAARECSAEKQLRGLIKENFSEDELCIRGLGEGEELISQSEESAVGDIAKFRITLDNMLH